MNLVFCALKNSYKRILEDYLKNGDGIISEFRADLLKRHVCDSITTQTVSDTVMTWVFRIEKAIYIYKATCDIKTRPTRRPTRGIVISPNYKVECIGVRFDAIS